MPKRLQRDMEKIKKMGAFLGAMVEERIRMSIKAIETWDGLAEDIIRRDYEIDELEIEVEEECLKILALHQPVAVDLRFLIATIKINSELERIGDEAVNIANRVRNISKRRKLDLSFDFSVMAEKAATMLRLSLDALVNLDLDLAFKVLDPGRRSGPDAPRDLRQDQGGHESKPGLRGLSHQSVYDLLDTWTGGRSLDQHCGRGDLPDRGRDHQASRQAGGTSGPRVRQEVTAGRAQLR